MRLTQHYFYLDLISIFCCSLFLFTWGLSTQEVIGFDSRFYLFALEMWRNGMSWFPTTYHQPYPDYLASSTILIYSLANLLGSLNKFVAILPSAIAASISLVFVYLIGAKHNRYWGINAVLLMMFTIAFFQSARSISLDLFVTMVTTICFYLVSQNPLRKSNSSYLIYLLFLLGFALRGPIGLVIPTGVVCSYYLLDRQFKQFLVTGCLAFILLLLAMLSLLFLAHQSGGRIFLDDVLRMQVLGRIDNHYFPYYFYLTNSLKNYALSFPIACLVMLGVVYSALIQKEKSAEFNFLIKLIGWAAVIIIGMSLPGDKKTRYILPMIPAVALLAAYLFNLSERHTYFVWLRHIATWIFFSLPFLFFFGLILFKFYTEKYQLNFGIHYFPLVVFLLILQMTNIYFCFQNRFDLAVRNTGILSMATLGFAICYIKMIEPIELSLNKSRDFVMQIEKNRLQDHARLFFYKEKPDNLPIKYLINMQDLSVNPIFLSQTQELLTISQPAYIVTSQNYFAGLPYALKKDLQIIAENKLGHVPVVVFVKKGIRKE